MSGRLRSSYAGPGCACTRVGKYPTRPHRGRGTQTPRPNLVCHYPPQYAFSPAQARQRLEHIKGAIAQGIVTQTTKAMLEEAEERVAELEAAFQAPAKPSVVALPVTVERYLSELRVLGRDIARARRILANLIGEVILRRHGDRPVAELRGNLQGILGLSCDSSGAGSPSRHFSTTPLLPLVARIVS